MQKTLLIALLGSILSIVIYHLNTVHSSTNQIDNLHQLLNPVKSLLVNQPNISIIADKKDVALYYQTQFILVPTIVERKLSGNDTILIIEKKEGKTFDCPFDNFKILFSSLNEDYNIVLCTRKF